MNKKLYIFLHVGIWCFMFLSPLTYMRSNGTPILHYLMSCMSPFLMMVVFYVNYFWLTPKCFVIGKRRFYFLYNFRINSYSQLNLQILYRSLRSGQQNFIYSIPIYEHPDR